MNQQDRSEAEAAIGESRGHRCKECNRMFSSGKALGGHVSSAHIQPANKDYSCKKLVMKSKTEDSGSGPHSCAVCAKRFPSQKSLYGHMRCHPDREWRGMEPPLRNELFSEEDSTDPESDYSGLDQDPDDETLRPSLHFVWPVTGKRGRLARCGNASPDPDRSWSLEDGAISAGRVLLNRMADSGGKEIFAPVALKGPEPVDTVRLENRMLARRGAAEATLKKQEGGHFHPGVEKRSTEETSHEIEARDRKRPRGNKHAPELKMSESETEKGKFESEVDLFLEAVSVLSNGKRAMGSRYVQNEEKLSPAGRKRDHSGLESKHICGTCNKGFQSPQALGGHMSSHNKLRMNVDTNSNNYLHQSTTGDTTSNGRGKSAEQSHVCPVCKKSFTTGQALGGHKKRHNTKKNTVNIGDGSSKENEANVRDFDLNKKPDADAWSC